MAPTTAAICHPLLRAPAVRRLIGDTVDQTTPIQFSTDARIYSTATPRFRKNNTPLFYSERFASDNIITTMKYKVHQLLYNIQILSLHKSET